jgi:hypothetical protein
MPVAPVSFTRTHMCLRAASDARVGQLEGEATALRAQLRRAEGWRGDAERAGQVRVCVCGRRRGARGAGACVCACVCVRSRQAGLHTVWVHFPTVV